MSTVDVKQRALFGKHENKMALAPANFTKHIVSDATKAEFADKFDVTIEASGTPSGVMLAASITRPMGSVVLKTTCMAGASDFNTAPFVVKELLIIGSRCGNFRMAIEALKAEKVEVKSLITKEYPLADGLKAMEHAGKKGAMKIQLVMDES